MLVRSDGGAQMGIGHVMRCLALAQAWQDGGGKVFWAMAAPPAGLADRVRREGIELTALAVPPGSPDDAGQTIDLARQCGARWVVVDGYHFGGAYQRAIKEAGLRMLAIDDYGHAEHYWADLVLNQNLHAEESLYGRREPATRLLMGPRYVLLRREFAPWVNWERTIPVVASKILVAFGGSDPPNASLGVIEAFSHLSSAGGEFGDLAATVVVGPSNPHGEQLAAAAARAPFPVRILSNVADMARLIAEADVALGGGGSANWEHAFLGLPTLMIVLAANQQPVAQRLDAMEVSENLGDYAKLDSRAIAARLGGLLLDRPRRESMSRKGRELIDGEGSARVRMHLTGSSVRLRKVREQDSRLLWQWANDPETRARSFSTDPIPWQSHVSWFSGKLNDPNCHLFIAVDDADQPVGQVRLDLAEGNGVISVGVASQRRGAGYGTAMIAAAIAEVSGRFPVRQIHAYIKPDNAASVRAFEKAGFRLAGTQPIAGCEAMDLIWSP